MPAVMPSVMTAGQERGRKRGQTANAGFVASIAATVVATADRSRVRLYVRQAVRCQDSGRSESDPVHSAGRSGVWERGDVVVACALGMLRAAGMLRANRCNRGHPHSC
jgi:hypothetical protein